MNGEGEYVINGSLLKTPGVAYTPLGDARQLAEAQRWTRGGKPFAPTFVVEIEHTATTQINAEEKIVVEQTTEVICPVPGSYISEKIVSHENLVRLMKPVTRRRCVELQSRDSTSDMCSLSKVITSKYFTVLVLTLPEILTTPEQLLAGNPDYRCSGC
ncbi:unnamed protein product [Phytophthora fragariaefolia]|uniref:Unnamed protein product n=1 Tax=Phytophthora fragariaefolia TaxID=1490495 RepID=A0A9W7CVH6_9STRA|nr:unnamed protein product [Phytophthora fragariaefolia]